MRVPIVHFPNQLYEDESITSVADSWVYNSVPSLTHVKYSIDASNPNSSTFDNIDGSICISPLSL